MGAFDIQVTNLINVDITRVAMTNLSSYLADTVILENIKIFNPCIKKNIFPGAVLFELSEKGYFYLINRNHLQKPILYFLLFHCYYFVFNSNSNISAEIFINYYVNSILDKQKLMPNFIIERRLKSLIEYSVIITEQLCEPEVLQNPIILQKIQLSESKEIKVHFFTNK